MNLIELDHALRKLRLSGMAAVLETRLRQAQTEKLAPIDLVSVLVSDELLRRQDRLLERRHKQAGFRDPDRSLDSFDFDFNKKMNSALIHDLATGRFIAHREDALFLGPPGTGKSHLAQAIGRAKTAGAHISAVCEYIHQHEGASGVRRMLGVLALAKKHGPAVVDEAAKAALDLGVPTYRFLRRYLERRLPAPLTLRQVDPLIRQLTLYRDLIDRKTGDPA